MRCTRLLGCCTALALAALAPARDAGPPAPRRDPARLGTPFDRYTVADRLGRTVTFYLSRPPKGATSTLPATLTKWMEISPAASACSA